MSLPYLIVYKEWMFDLVFLPQEGELFVREYRLPRKRNRITSKFFPHKPELAYGADGQVYEVDYEAIQESQHPNNNLYYQYDWWDRLCDWCNRWFCGGYKDVPVRYLLKKPKPYEYAELRARIAEILRKDGDCYSQFGTDTQKAAEHIEKTKNYLDLMTYFSRRRFLWMCCNDNTAKNCRERLKLWCAEQRAENGKEKND